MEAELTSLIGLQTFSTGRRLRALRQALQVVEGRKDDRLETLLRSAVEEERSVWALEQEGVLSGRTLSASLAVSKIDYQVDRALTAIQGMLDAASRTADQSDPLLKRIFLLVRALFPKGLAVITTLPFPDELAEVERIVGLLRGPQAATAQELALERCVVRLEQLLPRYREAVAGITPDDRVLDRLRVARERGQRRMLQVVAVILGTYPEDTPEHRDARWALLQPILDQDEDVRMYQKLGKPAPEVDPETGLVTETSPGA
jgi:hypothetical protein